jgi:hypothetical protein
MSVEVIEFFVYKVYNSSKQLIFIPYLCWLYFLLAIYFFLNSVSYNLFLESMQRLLYKQLRERERERERENE